MKIKWLFGLILCCAIIISCSTAKMVRLPNAPISQHAPLNEERGGIVDYGEGDKEDAYRLMYEACNGKYIVLKEGQQETMTVIVPVAGILVGVPIQVNRIIFECVNKSPVYQPTQE